MRAVWERANYIAKKVAFLSSKRKEKNARAKKPGRGGFELFPEAYYSQTSSHKMLVHVVS
jgi:hypothetical protein